MTALLQSGNAAYQAKQARAQGKGVKVAPKPVNIYRAEIEAFSAALQNDSPNPLTAELGLHSQKVMAACYESARTGRMVRIK